MMVITIILILFILIKIVMTIEIKLEFENIKIKLDTKKKLNNDNKILLKIYILNKIKISEIDLKKININRNKFKDRITKLRKNNSNLSFNLNAIDILRRESFLIEKMDLQVIVGTENAALTAIIVGIIASIIGNIIRDKCKEVLNQKFNVIPNYENINFLKIEFNGIFSVKIANIIDIAKLLIKKGRVKEHDRTSNRRSYVYSNE